MTNILNCCIIICSTNVLLTFPIFGGIKLLNCSQFLAILDNTRINSFFHKAFKLFEVFFKIDSRNAKPEAMNIF